MGLTQEQLSDFCTKLGQRLPELLRFLDIHDYHENYKNVQLACPIHNGDKRTSCVLGKDGTFKCYSRNCHKIFCPSLIGFVRGVLSNRQGWSSELDTGKVCSFPKTLEFVTTFLGEKPIEEEIPLEKQELSNYTRIVASFRVRKSPINFSREIVKESLQIPSAYFLKRGFSEAVLIANDIGDCRRAGAELNGRACFPVYDSNWVCVGATGRSIFDKCKYCDCYHNPLHLCPEDKFRPVFSKYKNQKGFIKEHYLYNYQNAKPHIENTNTAVVVESPANVLRLQEAGINSAVAIFGASISLQQVYLLNQAGALNLIVCLDNDQAGEEGKKRILDFTQNTHSLCFLTPSKNDLADMTVDEVKKLFSKYL